MRVALVDDENLALLSLKAELDEIEDIEIVGMYKNPLEFLDDYGKIIPDVVFLDIEMNQHNGFQVLEKLMEQKKNPAVILVTAFQQYAAKAFEVEAIDYIVKPALKERLKKALNRIRRYESVKTDNNIAVEVFKYFHVTINNRSIGDEWNSKKSEELFAYLLCANGRYIKKEKITSALWPYIEQDKVIANLYSAQYKLKKLLKSFGFDELIESEHNEIRMSIEDIRCDMFEFNKCMGNNIKQVETAIKLYKGLPFENKGYVWTKAMQAEYHTEYIRFLGIAVTHYKSKRDKTMIEYYDDKLKSAHEI